VYSSDTLSTAELVQRFQSTPGVVAVSPDYQRSITMTPNDPFFPNLWGLENTGQAVSGTTGTAGADIDATTAWDTAQGAGTVVADIDSGVDYTHPDLNANMWVNPGEIPGNGIDDDHDGYVDDVYGIDAAAGDSDPMDENGHGTHTAGTIAAVGNNNIGVIGVAPQAKVMALRFLDASGNGADSAAITCINYAISMKLNHGVNVVAISASWGGSGYDTLLYNAVQNAANAGIVFVTAAGNNGTNNESTPFYPANYGNANLIAVGASTSNDQRASFSNYGPTKVDLFAPGSNIESTYWVASHVAQYAYESGTSMATPHVSGTIALVAGLHPTDSVATRINRVLLSVDKVSAFSGLCVTGGRLNAANAVATAPPTISSLSSATGTTAGGTTVVISGTGFIGLSGPSAVTFGGTNATGYTVDSPTQITATVPAHTAGTVSVRVTGAFGASSDTANDDYVYWAPVPAITGLNPTSGYTTGTNSVVMTGTGFTGATSVLFGSTPATTFNVDSDTQITAVAPAGSVGTVRAQVTTAGGTTPDTSADDYTYLMVPVPTVSALTPTQGPTIGGTSLVVTGTNLTGATAVVFGSTNATAFHVDSNTQVTATAPAHAAGTVSVLVTTAGGTNVDTSADHYLYVVLPVPAVSGLAPTAGPVTGGTSVVITGSNFSGATAVSFGGTAATAFTVNSGTRITATAPARAPGAVQVQVTGPGGSSPEVTADDFTYFARPAIASLSPATGPTAGGTSVVITGANFVGLSGAAAVTFGGVNATSYSVDSATQITATAPAHIAGAVRLQVIAAGGTTADTGADDYTYTSPALQSYQESDGHIGYVGSWVSFKRASASGGAYERAKTSGSSATIYFNGDKLDWIAMKGTTTGKADVYLDGAFKTTVDLSAAAATYQVDVWNTGLLANGLHHVTIQWNTGNAAGKYVTLDRVDVLGTIAYAPPAITSLSPSLGATAGGTTVAINGSGFTEVSGLSAVTFGGVNATSYTVNSPSKITAVAPAHAAGAVQVQVTAAGGATFDTAADDFTYVVAPTMTRLDVTAANAAFVWTTAWGSFTTASAFGGSYLRSSAAGAQVVIPFNGQQLDWIATKGTTTGTADVYVDNVLSATVNLAASPVAYQQKVYSTGILAAGYHTVKIVRRSDNISGKYITVDAIDLAGSLAAPVRTEDSTRPSPFVWNPVATSWTSTANASASGGAYTSINMASASITFNFTGVKLDIIARTASSFGIASISIDGGTPVAVSLYSSAAGSKKWSTGFLAPGNHTVVFSRSGRKSSSSTGYTIDLDAVDLTGVFR
jgi:subtilisin family serine protease